MLKCNREMQQKNLYLFELKKTFFIACFFIFIINSFEFASAKLGKVSQQQKSNSLLVKETPRKDLYEKIRRKTGISLRQLFHIVFQRGNVKSNQLAFARLAKYVSKKGTAGMDREYQQKMQSIKAFCDKKQELVDCYSQIDDLKKEQSSLKKLKDKAKTDKSLAMYYYLTVLTQSIKSEIFERAHLDFVKACPPDKINSDICMKKRKGMRNLYDIADRLRHVAQAQIRRKAKKTDKNTKEIAEHIDKLIAAYE